MTTSANVIEYDIYKGENIVGSFRVNVMCKFPDYAELIQYQPLSEHDIQAWGYDEEEEDWSDDMQNLEKFLKKLVPMNKWIRQYFNGDMTAEEAVKAAKDAERAVFDGIIANLKKQRDERRRI